MEVIHSNLQLDIWFEGFDHVCIIPVCFSDGGRSLRCPSAPTATRWSSSRGSPLFSGKVAQEVKMYRNQSKSVSRPRGAYLHPSCIGYVTVRWRITEPHKTRLSPVCVWAAEPAELWSLQLCYSRFNVIVKLASQVLELIEVIFWTSV